MGCFGAPELLPKYLALLSRDAAYSFLTKVTAVEITTTIRNIPQEVRLGRREGLKQPSVANFDALNAVPLAWLTKRAGQLSGKRVEEVKAALGHALGWPELTIVD